MGTEAETGDAAESRGVRESQMLRRWGGCALGLRLGGSLLAPHFWLLPNKPRGSQFRLSQAPSLV